MWCCACITRLWSTVSKAFAKLIKRAIFFLLSRASISIMTFGAAVLCCFLQPDWNGDKIFDSKTSFNWSLTILSNNLAKTQFRNWSVVVYACGFTPLNRGRTKADFLILAIVLVVKLKLKICERGSAIKSAANFKKKGLKNLIRPCRFACIQFQYSIFSALLTSEIDTNKLKWTIDGSTHSLKSQGCICTSSTSNCQIRV